MKISLWLIIKIELMKFMKRNDLLSVTGIVSIGLIYAIGMRNETYTGVENQDALFWIALQFITVTVLFIGPVVTAFLGTQMLSSEVDNKSISLFTVRIRNRKKLYIGKSLALMIISSVFFAISVSVMMVIYFFIANSGNKFVSGKLTGNNADDLLCIMLLVFMYAFFFIPQFALSVGVKLKPLLTIVISFLVALVCNHVLTYSFLKYLNPMSYIYSLSDHVLETTEAVAIDSGDRAVWVIMQILLCCIYYILFTIKGIKAFEGKDL